MELAKEIAPQEFFCYRGTLPVELANPAASQLLAGCQQFFWYRGTLPVELADPAGAQLLAGCQPTFGRPGASNPLARGEQSEPRTAENAPQNQSISQLIGRKKVYPSQPSPWGRFSKGGGRSLLDCEFLSYRGRLCGTRRS